MTSYAEQLITNTYGRQYYIYRDDKFFQQRIANAGPYQKRNLIALRRLVPHARTILDIGMNIGMNTVEYSTFADEVHGFEPTPQTYDMAKRAIDLNRNQTATKNWFEKWDPNANMTCTGKMYAYQVGIGAASGYLDILIKKDNAGQNHIDNIDVPTRTGKQRVRRVEPEKVNVPIKTIDEYGFDAVDIIKIDTEGYEYPVLLGAEKTIDTHRPIVQVEMDDSHTQRFGTTCQNIVDWFVNKSYNVYLCDGTLVGDVWAPVPKMVERFFVPKEAPLNLFV